MKKLWTKYEAEIDTIEYDKLLDPDNYKEEYINIAMPSSWHNAQELPVPYF